ncbi:MAG TPA: hypothetical protein PKH50_02385 [bacterium]|jgi:hypothetical protein|nr:hypothetical protein [bacterium]
MKKNKTLYIIGVALLTISTAVGITYAAFTDKAKVLGSTFKVGSANIMFLENLTLETDPQNYKDELPGPVFNNIGPGWTQDYLVKLVNATSSKITVSTNANYQTADDPKDLRSDIFVEIIRWSDANQNGIVDSGEETSTIGKKTIIKWKTEGFALGDLLYGQTMGLILRFSTPSLSESKQGATAVFDFEFNSVQS